MLIVLENIENNTSLSREFATYLANVAEISKDPTLIKKICIITQNGCLVQERKKNLSIILYRLWPESTQGNKWLTHMVMFTQSSRDPTKSILDYKGMWNWKQSTMPNYETIKKYRNQTHRPLFKVKDFMSFQEPLWIFHSAKSLSHLLEHFVTSHLDGK